jgi:hypothetical protein
MLPVASKSFIDANSGSQANKTVMFFEEQSVEGWILKVQWKDNGGSINQAAIQTVVSIQP